MKVRIKYMQPDTKRLAAIDKGDWIDVYADETKVIYEGEHKLIKLGFAMELPQGYEAHLAPRSSTFKKWGIIVANSFGVIDESYKGDNDEWMLSVYCLQGQNQNISDGGMSISKPYSIIERGDKIAQFRIIEKMPKIEFEEVDSLDNEDRGGFGSTGSK